MSPRLAAARPRAANRPFALLARLAASTVVLSSFVAAQGQLPASTPQPFDLPLQSFHSTPVVSPELRVHLPPTDEASTDLVTFIGVRGATAAENGNFGPYLLDSRGEVLWMGPKGSVLNVGKHTYQGEPVIAYYTGTEEHPGFGRGVYKLYDQSYQHIATVEAGGELTNLTDPHDFQITPDDTAVIETRIPREMDLSPLGGPTTGGFAFDCVIQEVDIATGELLFQWRSMDHIPLTETLYELLTPAGTKAQPFDAHHLNAVSKDESGNFLISLRGPSTVYYISRETGEILWRLGGSKTSFKMGDKTDFHFQHHSRLHGSGASSPFTVTLFSNGANQFRQTADQARALVLKVDTDKMEVELEKEYLPSFHMPCSSEGSMQILDNGNVVVGWGIRPQFSEFTEDGKLVHDVQFGQVDGRSNLDHSYRVYKASWTGRPLTPPSIVLDEQSSATAYVSWNGATDVASYRLYTGVSPDTLLPAASPSSPSPTDNEKQPLDATHVPKTSFEMRIDLPHDPEARFVAVVAHDRLGRPLRSSEILDRKVRVGTGLYADVDALWWAERRRVIELGGLSVVFLTVLAYLARRRGFLARASGYVPLHAGSLTLPTHSSTPSPLKTPPVTSESRMWSPTGEWATMPVKQAQLPGASGGSELWQMSRRGQERAPSDGARQREL